MIELIELENGDLEVRVVNRKQFLTLLANHVDNTTTLFDLLVSSAYIGNGYEVLVNESLPTIGFGASYDDDMNFVGYYDEWVGENCFMTELKKYNYVTFFKIK